jgi:hypothetical protein
MKRLSVVLVSVLLLSGIAFSQGADADHSWGGYHWARTSNSFTLKVGDNVSAAWDSYLSEAKSDWSLSTVLDLAIVTGTVKNPKSCRATSGRIEACSANYGNNGWLGLAQIWISGSHITQALTKMNDFYFQSAELQHAGVAPTRDVPGARPRLRPGSPG